MPITPLYDPASVSAAYQLRYSWTAWPAIGRVTMDLTERVRPLWEEDGMRLLEQHCADGVVQILYHGREHDDGA